MVWDDRSKSEDILCPEDRRNVPVKLRYELVLGMDVQLSPC